MSNLEGKEKGRAGSRIRKRKIFMELRTEMQELGPGGI
jgi:hypothetical protein